MKNKLLPALTACKHPSGYKYACFPHPAPNYRNHGIVDAVHNPSVISIIECAEQRIVIPTG